MEPLASPQSVLVIMGQIAREQEALVRRPWQEIDDM